MVYDCFSFFNELDLLEIRLNVLKDVVDRFVLVEAVRTHTGKEKPLFFKENEARFAEFSDRIIHITVTDFSSVQSMPESRRRAWFIENLQRNSIVEGLSCAKDDDVVMISDVDEIPKPEAVKRAVSLGGVVRLGMKSCNYYLNYCNCVSPNWKLGTQVLKFSVFKNPATYRNFKFSEFVLEQANSIPSASMVRFLKSKHTLSDAGWHFSYLGGTAVIRKKLNAFAHTEFNSATTTAEEWIMSRISAGEDLFRRGDRFFAERINDTYPAYIRENQERYADLILNVDESYFKRTKWARRRSRIKGIAMRAVASCIPNACVPFIMRLRDKVNGVKGGLR